MAASGILLQLKKNWSWVQPTERRGAGSTPAIGFDRIVAIARAVPEAGIASWADVDRVDVRPGKGMMKIRSRSNWELQVDSESGAVLQSTYRRTDLIESLHDGSWFHSSAKLWIFLPSGAIVLILWATGVYLWLLPYSVRHERALRLAAAHAAAHAPASSPSAAGNAVRAGGQIS